MFSGRVNNCCDSHVHWQDTGAFEQRLRLHELKSVEDLSRLKVSSDHFLSDWLLGFGWDQNVFINPAEISRQSLDKIFPNHPVVFSRIDGHAYWVNTLTLKKCGLYRRYDNELVEGGRVDLDGEGWPTGLLIDRAMSPVRKNMPAPTQTQIYAQLQAAQKLFHKAGFTHIRDLTCDEDQWAAMHRMVENKDLHMAVEQNISCEDPEDFFSRLEFADYARKHAPSAYVRLQGVKVYFDGALGSDGALISCGYCGSKNQGLQLIQDSHLTEMLRSAREKAMDLAVHVIGDEAAHRVARLAADHWGEQGGHGPTLHLEHAQLLRPETIAILQRLKVHVHMQPCHWLSDKKWLKKKIAPLMDYLFRWQDLEHKKILFDFGSDTPIEETSFTRNLLAVQDAYENGIPKIERPENYHFHRDSAWTPETWTEFENGLVTRLVFLGKDITIPF